MKQGDAPESIDTTTLLVRDKSTLSGWRPKKGILPPKLAENKNEGGILRVYPISSLGYKCLDNFPGHYRRITLEAWYLLVDMYGVKGPAIAVYGEPVDDKSRWGIFKDPRQIDKVSDQIYPLVPQMMDDGFLGSA